VALFGEVCWVPSSGSSGALVHRDPAAAFERCTTLDGQYRLPVVQHGALVGVVNRDAIVHFLEVPRSLGVEHATSDTHTQFSRVAQRTIGEEWSILRHVPSDH
jgi:hypothetical protein